jgi:hypothetical protein
MRTLPNRIPCDVAEKHGAGVQALDAAGRRIADHRPQAKKHHRIPSAELIENGAVVVLDRPRDLLGLRAVP